MKWMNRGGKKANIWPFVGVGVLLLVGYIYWDYARYRQVEEYAFISPEIPGTEVTGGSPVELARFHEIQNSLTRKMVQGDIRITVIWNTPAFFRALAAVEGAQDIKRHETLFHAYADKFGFMHDLVFTVILDSASLDLRTYPAKENGLLRNDKGVEVVPWHWLEGRGSSARHLEGVLSFPQRTKSGSPMMGHLTGEHLPGEKPAAILELVLKGLPGGEAVFRWDLSSVSQGSGS